MKKLLVIMLLIGSSISHADDYGSDRGVDYRTDSNSPQIYYKGEYRGNLNNNPYDPNSVSNPYGEHGNKYNPNSINNPYSDIGNPYNTWD